ncbi:hypothetical protein FRB94_004217 [Tulasnella sp. JGI-2019a]|nr:hypothetical protein FRB94_004217 [Tulasnella sp. JGI-2019a]
MSTTQYTQPDDINDITASVRRHHTISAVNRAHRTQARTSISVIENEEDEIVGDDWSGGVGAVGEGKGLHRQSSLPSRHSGHRGHHHGGSSGSATPSRQAVNSLSVIAAEHGPDGEDGEDEWWERQMRGLRGDASDQFSRNVPLHAPGFDPLAHGSSSLHTASQQISHEPLHSRSYSQSSHSSSIAAMEPSSPPIPNDLSGAGGVRRHQSLTHGHHTTHETGARSLMRSATHGKTKYSRRAQAPESQAPDVPPVPDQYSSQPAEGHDANRASPGSGGSPGSGLGHQWGPPSSSSSPSVGGAGGVAWSSTQQQADDLAESLAALDVGNNNGLSGQMRYANQTGNYYPTGLYGPSASLAQPNPNPNHMRKLTPPPSQAPRFRSPSPRHNQQEQLYASGAASPGLLNTGTFSSSGQPNSATGRSPIHKLSLVTNIHQSQGQGQPDQGPVSAAAYVPPPGGGLPLGERLGGHSSQEQNGDPNATPIGSGSGGREKSLTATGISWDEKHRIAGTRGGDNGGASGVGPQQTANAANFFLNPALFSTFDPSLQQQLIQHFQNQGLGGSGPGGGTALPQQTNIQQQQQFGGAQMPSNQQLMQLMQQQQMLQQQMIQQQQLYQPPPHGQYAMAQHHGVPSRLNTQLATNQLMGSSGNSTPGNGENPDGSLISPVDLPTLIANKGYNPSTFDTTPQFARYFVIKSYTEDDVHKSIKYEIWSSTDPGNKRLDKAFKETNGRGPIYLFFSVNASGHFCGMAEMLTPVDYTRSSTVWAQDKWKGVFKVKWIFIKDIPNGILRHIRLTNTQEQKAVTNSRDTQELLPDAGHEMLRICLTHTSRTSLLQDFLYYEVQSLQKTLQPGTGTPGLPPSSPQPQQQQPFQPSPGMPTAGQFTQYPNQIQNHSYGIYPFNQNQPQQGRQPGMASPPPRMPSAQGFTTGGPQN